MSKLVTKLPDWFYRGGPIQDEQIPVNAVAFIYRITYLGDPRLSGGKFFYIGQKALTHSKTKVLPKKQQLTVKGIPRKIPRKIKTVSCSNWKNYTGSCKELNAFIETQEPHLFRREILQFVYSKKQAHYYEAKYILCEELLERTDNWNGNLLGKFFPKDVK